VCAIPDGREDLRGDDVLMTRSQRTHRMGDARFFMLFNLAHAAIAFPTLRLWAEYCARRKHAR
jgi:hypothetical protein